MTTTGLRHALVTLSVLALASGACGGGSDYPSAPPGPGPGDPPAPVALPGRVVVTVQTTGGDPDSRYDVFEDGAAFPRVIGSGGTTTFDLAAGARTITLLDVNPNCSVVGTNPVTVSITPGVTSSVTFVVECVATGISVTVSTTGSSIPGTYMLFVATPAARPLGSNSVTAVTALPTGPQTVTLSLYAENCTVVGGATVTVQIVNRTIVPVRFDVQCTAIARLERIAYAVYTSGFPAAMRVSTVKPDGTAPMTVAGGHYPAWSRDGNTIVFSTTFCEYDYYYYYGYSNCTGGLVAGNPETRAFTVLANTSEGIEPTLSPTGTEVAFIRCCTSSGAALYIARLDGSPAVEISTKTPAIPTSSVATPSWSPDGQRLAFACVISGNSELCTMKRDGTELTRLTSTPQQQERDPAWSPDGRTLAFTLTSLGSGQVTLINATGGVVTPLVAGFNPDWSPDGTRLVFARNSGLFTMSADGTGVTQITTTGESSPAWRP